MSVLIETTLGEIVVDLFTKDCYRSSLNFLKLCKLKYYNFHLFEMIDKDYVGQVNSYNNQHQSIWGIVQGPDRNLFKAETKRKHSKKGVFGIDSGLVSFNTTLHGDLHLACSQFFITLGDGITTLDENAVFGQVMEGFDVLDKINNALVDDDKRPFIDIRITHTTILDDPFDDLQGMVVPISSPVPTKEMLQTVRVWQEETKNLTPQEILEKERKDEAEARALTLEIIGDLPFAEIKPPDNVLFVCKLNPITRSQDLQLIFSRFGEIVSCEVVCDKFTGDSLCFAFIEFETAEACEQAYIKMNNVLIDDRRIHCDFSQSVSKINYMQETKGIESIESEQGFGGVGLKKKTKYRNEQSKQEYEMIFETEKSRRGDERGRNAQENSIADVGRDSAVNSVSVSTKKHSRDAGEHRKGGYKESARKRSRSPDTRDTRPRHRDYSPETRPRHRDYSPETRPRHRDYSPDSRSRRRDYSPNSKPRHRDYSPDSRPRHREYSPDSRHRDSSKYSPDTRHRHRDYSRKHSTDTDSKRNRSTLPLRNDHSSRPRSRSPT
jgi:peptidyl-prolyl cis-trans isomerase-like 4